MENKLTAELLEKAKQAKTPEELPDDVLDNVAGGNRICGIDSDDNRPLRAAASDCKYYINEDTLEAFCYNQTCSTCLRRNGGSVLPCPNPERCNI